LRRRRRTLTCTLSLRSSEFRLRRLRVLIIGGFLDDGRAVARPGRNNANPVAMVNVREDFIAVRPTCNTYRRSNLVKICSEAHLPLAPVCLFRSENTRSLLWFIARSISTRACSTGPRLWRPARKDRRRQR
jgi:hypothetical protein